MNRPQVLLDTNFVVGLFDRTDSLSTRAQELYRLLKEENYEIFASDVLIIETLSVLGRRYESKKNTAVFPVVMDEVMNHFSRLPVLCLYELIPGHFNQILQNVRISEGRFNFHDSLILLTLQAVRDAALLTFDNDFKQVPWLKVMN